MRDIFHTFFNSFILKMEKEAAFMWFMLLKPLKHIIKSLT